MPSRSIITIAIDGTSHHGDLSYLKNFGSKQQKKNKTKNISPKPTTERQPQPVTCDCGKQFKHPDDMAQHKLTASQHRSRVPTPDQSRLENRNSRKKDKNRRPNARIERATSAPDPLPLGRSAAQSTSPILDSPVATLKPKGAFDPRANTFIPPRVPLFRAPPSQNSGYSTPLIDLEEFPCFDMDIGCAYVASPRTPVRLPPRRSL